MKWTETRIPRHLDTPAVIEGGIHDAYQTVVMKMWADEYYVIRNPQARLRRFGRAARPTPGRRTARTYPFLSAVLITLAIALDWLWQVLEGQS